MSRFLEFTYTGTIIQILLIVLAVLFLLYVIPWISNKEKEKYQKQKGEIKDYGIEVFLVQSYWTDCNDTDIEYGATNFDDALLFAINHTINRIEESLDEYVDAYGPELIISIQNGFVTLYNDNLGIEILGIHSFFENETVNVPKTSKRYPSIPEHINIKEEYKIKYI